MFLLSLRKTVVVSVFLLRQGGLSRTSAEREREANCEAARGSTLSPSLSVKEDAHPEPTHID